MLVEVVLGGAVLLLLAWVVFGRPSGLPPGRWGFPLVGYFPLDGKYIDDKLKELQSQFGDIYIWRMGTILQLYLHDYNLCRQVFGSADFANRPDMSVFRGEETKVTLGVASSNGAIWHANRRFSLRQLRDLGMGKSGLVSAVHEQAEYLLEAINKSAGKAEPITPALNTAITNIIWQMCAGKQFSSDDPRQEAFRKLMQQINESFAVAFLADLFPWMMKVLPSFITRKLFLIDEMHNAENTFFHYFDELIQEHRENLDPDDPKDLMDAYLIEMDEMHKKKEGLEDGAVRSELDLKFVMFDLFFAGTDTTNTTMKWIFLYMAAFPEVQRKLQQEIDEVLPKDTMVTLEDKARMPYTEAVIHEVLRKSSLANLGFFHSAVRDTTVAGYKIPKDTVVTSCTASIHHDPRYWEKPDHFLPERWLSPEGKFVMKKEGFLPFGIGKRVCLGEGLSRMELQVLTTAVFQKFSVAPPNGKLVDLQHNPNIQFSHESKPQDVVFTVRNSEIKKTIHGL